jgi:1-aminocyclopropane-1-carboxylate deaminase
MPELVVRLAAAVGHSPLTYLPDPFPEPVAIRLWLKRDDLLHPLVSGNKWRKLTYNLLEASRLELGTLLTFGGAYSNHLHATAAAGTLFGFQTIGIVRGEELANQPLNPTLAFCQQQGMYLHFVSRDEYRRRADATYLTQLQARFGPCYVVPEGGTNALAVRGTSKIFPEIQAQLGTLPHTVACAVGTAGTLAGLVASAPAAVQVLGISALKGQADFPVLANPMPANALINSDYHFGGYARITPPLLAFIRQFEAQTGILLEPTYTGKLLYAVFDLARNGFFPTGATVVAVHTGGLQARA